MIYKLYKTSFNTDGAITINSNPQVSFLFDPANTDYAKFKLDIANGAELQDADGNVMTAEQVLAFLETLP